MRFLDLRLTACGPFTNQTLDLSDGDRGLHILFGPNEAGKSSTLRAIGYLLFGFPLQNEDNFLHDYGSLRVGARLENDRGEEMEVVRRKTAKNSLRAGDDSEPVGEDELRRFCGYLDEDRFRNFFGIDHQRMIEGGRTIAAGGGDIGQVLLTGGGVRDLKGVADELEREAREIFNLKARNPRLNKRLTEVGEVKRKIRDSALSAGEWAEHRAALEAAQTRKQAAEAEFQAKTRECSRLDRIRKALPLIAELNDRRAELALLADAPLLAADFTKRRQKIEADLRLASSEHERLTGSITASREELAALQTSPALLKHRAAIEQIAGELSIYRQAESDRPGLEANLAQLEESARAIIARLGQNFDFAAAETLQVPEAKRLRIRGLRGEFVLVTKEIDDAAAAVAQFDRERENAEHELADVPPVRDTNQLAAAVQDALRLGDAEEQRLELASELESRAAEMQTALNRLPLWNGSLEQLESLDTPLVETIDRFESELAGVAQVQTTLQSEKAQRQEEARRVQQELEALRQQFDPLTEANLQQARRKRDAAWQAVREAWRDGAKPSDPGGTLFALTDGLGGLADEFERSMATADEIADRLRRESERVARHLQLTTQQESCRERLTAIESELSAAIKRRDELSADWNDSWPALAAAPLSPREMRAWLVKRAEIVRTAEEQRRDRARLEQLEARIEDQRRRLAGALGEFGESASSDSAPLAQLIRSAQQLLESAAQTEQERGRIESELKRIERHRRGAAAKLSAAHEGQTKWHEQWQAAIEGLPVEAAGNPADVDQILELLAALAQHLRDAKGLRTRLGSMDQQAAQLDRGVRGVAAEIAPDLQAIPVPEAAREMAARLSQSLADEEKRSDRSQRIETEETLLRGAVETIASLQTELSALCAEAACQSPGELPAAEERSSRRRELAGVVEALERQLRDLSAGQGLEPFMADAKAVDPDTLELQYAQLDEQVAALDRELRDVIGQEIGRQQQILAQMDSGSQAADAAEQLQDLLARIAADSEEYARLRVALVALRKGVERYRERHQGPICRRASQFFARLTLGTYSALREDFDEHGKPELVGIRSADQKPIHVNQMSDGTADQLYLAVRLAWLEEYLDEHESIPLIVDDVIMRFDNERSIAALQLLADLSRRTQVIFFTHHRHVVDLAERSIDAELLFVHELADKPSFVAELIPKGSQTVAGG